MKLDIFALASGCKVNLQKSQAIYIGSNIGKLRKPFENKGLNWPSTEIKYLGVNIPVDNLCSCAIEFLQLDAIFGSREPKTNRISGKHNLSSNCRIFAFN